MVRFHGLCDGKIMVETRFSGFFVKKSFFLLKNFAPVISLKNTKS